MATAFFIAATADTVFRGLAEFWVSPAGNDANPGTQALPWRTYARAAAEAMKYTVFGENAKMVLHFAAGSYARTTTSGIMFRKFSNLIFLGDESTILQAPTVMAAGTNNALPIVGFNFTPTEGSITVAAPLTNPAIDAYVGKVVRITAAADPLTVGLRYTIASNTSTVIRLADNRGKSVGSFVVGDTFVIEEPTATLTQSLSGNEYEFENCFGSIEETNPTSAVVMCNFKLTGTFYSTRNSNLLLLGIDAPSTILWLGGTSEVYLGASGNREMLALLGAPVAASGLFWFGWYAYGGLFRRVTTTDFSFFVTNGYVFNGDTGSTPHDSSKQAFYGGRHTGSFLGPADTSLGSAGAVVVVWGGGGPARIESFIICRSGTITLIGAAIATLPNGSWSCINIESNGLVNIGMYANQGFGVRGGSGPGHVQPALTLSNGACRAAVNQPFTLTGGAGVDWSMPGMSGVAAAILPNTQLQSVSGASIARAG